MEHKNLYSNIILHVLLMFRTHTYCCKKNFWVNFMTFLEISGESMVLWYLWMLKSVMNLQWGKQNYKRMHISPHISLLVKPNLNLLHICVRLSCSFSVWMKYLVEDFWLSMWSIEYICLIFVGVIYILRTMGYKNNFPVYLW